MAQLLRCHNGNLLSLRVLAWRRMDFCGLGSDQWSAGLHCLCNEAQELEASFPSGIPHDCSRRRDNARTVRFIFVPGCMACLLGNAEFPVSGEFSREAVRSIAHFVISHRGIGLRLTVALGICWFMPNSKTMEERFHPTALRLIASAGLMLLCLMEMNKVVQFLYFQF